MPSVSDAGAHLGAQDPSPESTIPCLRLIWPGDRSVCIKIEAAPRTIGSGPNADIVFKDDHIAPIHCRISRQGSQVRVDDLGSPDGTWVENQKISHAVLETGQQLRVGLYRFVAGQRPVAPRSAETPPVQQPGTDDLTGVPNRAWILARAQAMLEAHADSSRNLTTALLSLNNLDEIQAAHGYQAGDRVLRRLARLVEGYLQENEAMGLFGPDRFLLLIPEISAPEAQQRLDRLISRVGQQSFAHDGGESHVKLSVGFVTRPGRDVASREQFITQAETALYRARRRGGEQVVGAD